MPLDNSPVISTPYASAAGAAPQPSGRAVDRSNIGAWPRLGKPSAVRPSGPAGHLLSESVLHEPYHDLHHRYPKIPYENLPAAAKVDPSKPGEVPLFANYWEALKDLLRGLADPKFGPAWRDDSITRTNPQSTIPARG